jgi:hypothetical protein
MPKKSTFADILKNLPPKADPPDILGEMGQGMLRMPFQLWEERFYFRGALNTALREKTGRFPARLGKAGETHPVYLLRKLGNFGFRACPCTSKKHNSSKYIRQGCVLEHTTREMDRDSYILEHMSFNLSEDDAFRRKLVFQGRVPETCLDSHHHDRRARG